MLKGKPLVLVVSFVAVAFSGCIGDEEGVTPPAIPVAAFTYEASADDPNTFHLDASSSQGADLSYTWMIGLVTIFTNETTIDFTFPGPAVYLVKLQVEDKFAIPDLTEQEITVGDGINTAPIATFDPEFRYYGVGEPVLVDAALTKDPEGDAIRYAWDFNFIMNSQQYETFRKQKASNEGDAAGAGTEVSPGGARTDDAFYEWLMGGTHDSPGHEHAGGIASTSTAEIRHTSDEPLFTLDAGFPEAGIFFIRLLAFDAKGYSEGVISEEIWPVQVVDQKEDRFATGSFNGEFHLGSSAAVTDTTPDEEGTYQDQAVRAFEIPRLIKTMYINLTWNENQGTGPTQNLVEMIVTSPSGKERRVQDPNEGTSSVMTLSLGGHENLGKGPWKVELYGRGGALIQWDLQYWAELDMNDFRTLEDKYFQ